MSWLKRFRGIFDGSSNNPFDTKPEHQRSIEELFESFSRTYNMENNEAPESYFGKTLLQIELGAYDHAMELAEQGLQEDPENILLMLCKADLLHIKGNTKEALHLLASTNDPKSYQMRISMHLKAGEGDKAKALLEPYLDGPADIVDKARILIKFDYHPRTSTFLLQATAKDSQNPDFFFALACSHLYAGELDKALKAAEQGFVLKPDSPKHYLLGVVHLLRDDLSTVEHFLTQSQRRFPDHLALQQLQTILLIRQGRISDAVALQSQLISEFSQNHRDIRLSALGLRYLLSNLPEKGATSLDLRKPFHETLEEISGKKFEEISYIKLGNTNEPIRLPTRAQAIVALVQELPNESSEETTDLLAVIDYFLSEPVLFSTIQIGLLLKIKCLALAKRGDTAKVVATLTQNRLNPEVFGHTFLAVKNSLQERTIRTIAKRYDGGTDGLGSDAFASVVIPTLLIDQTIGLVFTERHLLAKPNNCAVDQLLVEILGKWDNTTALDPMLNRILAERPLQADALHIKASLLAKTHPKKALRLLELVPTEDAYYLRQQAMAFLRIEDYEQALLKTLKGLPQVIDDPEAVQHWIATGFECYCQLERYEACLSFLDSWSGKANITSINSMKGITLSNLNREAEAIPLLEEAVREEPENFLAQYHLATSCHAQEHYPRAAEAWTALSQGIPDLVEAWRGLSKTRLALDQEKRALSAAKKALDLNHEDPESWLQLSFAQYWTKDLNGMLASRKAAYRLAPDDFAVLYHLADAYADFEPLEGEDFKQALTCISKAINICPEDAECWDLRGWILASAAHFKQAICNYDQAIKLKPKIGHFYNGRGYAFLKLGRIEEAHRDLNYSLKLQPDNHFLYRHLACLASVEGDLDKAARHLKKAVAMNTANWSWAKTEPCLDPLREHKDYQRLAKQVPVS